MDIENSRFISVLSELSEKRERRNRKLLEILADMGYPLYGRISRDSSQMIL